jgi:hypothetical protein
MLARLLALFCSHRHTMWARVNGRMVLRCERCHLCREIE